MAFFIKFKYTHIKTYIYIIYTLLITFLFLVSCENDSYAIENNNDDILFIEVDSAKTGIQFENTLYNQKMFNIFNYRNFYNGGGVAIGDINNDGLPDIYLTSNLGKNKLYLNQGDFKFKDISESSGTLGEKAWSTGVVLVDINADNLLDIYVCNAGNIEGDNQKNELFINNGDLTFSEQAENYNLADSGFTTHSAFFDYDKDGDLDAYILNNSFIPVNTLNYSNKRDLRSEDWNFPDMFKGGGDRLLRNDNGKFTDVSETSGIYGSLIGFGLGVTVADINDDNYPDLYISNDFFERDYLYINNQNGTFTEAIENWTEHISMFSMGADIADINNDAKPDIFVTDMLPETDERLKNTTHFDSYDIDKRKKQLGFYNQLMQNTLQLNIGNNKFQEIANYGNVARTDWSWGALLFDMDNDGYKDIYVCNGINKDLTNQDFIDFFANDIIQKMVLTGKKQEIETIINKMPSTPISNYAFLNNRDLTFSNVTSSWGLEKPSFSNGASYGDLDNDGDLDLIINNVNQPLLVYKNLTTENKKNHYLKLKLKGEAPNTFAIGSRVDIYTKNNKTISYQINPSKGFQSSTEYTISVGLGKESKIDSLKVFWPNNTTQTLKKIAVDTTLILFENQSHQNENKALINNKKLLKQLTSGFTSHKENNFIDFDYEGLIFEMLSQEGPAMALGDINNDGHQDIYIGGSRGQVGKVYLHDGAGVFTEIIQDTFTNDINLEDTAVVMLDANNDGNLDILIGSGGNEINFKQYNINRLYLNRGGGLFDKAKIISSTGDNVSVIAPEDFDNDGDIDLFIASRSVPGVYGINPKHLFLENDGFGNFKNVTTSIASDIDNIGMITDAAWANIDSTSEKELILSVDWGNPIILKKVEGKMSVLKNPSNYPSGWWQSVFIDDIDNDGDNDLVLGNKGLNTPYRTTIESPMKIYINDFDNNGTIEQIITHQIAGKNKPINLKRELYKQLPHLQKQNLKYSEYSKKSIEEIFPEDILKNSIIRTSVTGESMIALNDGKGNFEFIALPKEAQFSSIRDITSTDVNKDGYTDLIYGGNNYALKPQFSRLDASYGGLLLGSENGFRFAPYNESGLFVEGEITNLKVVPGNKEFIVIGVNNRQSKIFTLNDE